MIHTIRLWFYRTLSAGLLAGPMLAKAQLVETDTTVNRGNEQLEISGLSDTAVTDIIIGIMQALLYIIGFLAIVAFVIAGIWYLTAAGDETRMETGKKTMIGAIIGIVVALVGLIIIGAVQNILAGDERF